MVYFYKFVLSFLFFIIYNFFIAHVCMLKSSCFFICLDGTVLMGKPMESDFRTCRYEQPDIPLETVTGVSLRVETSDLRLSVSNRHIPFHFRKKQSLYLRASTRRTVVDRWSATMPANRIGLGTMDSFLEDLFYRNVM